MNILKQAVFALFILFIAVSNSFASKKEVTNKINQYLTAVQHKEVKTIKNLISDESNFTMVNNIVDKTEILNEEDYVKSVKEGKVGSWVTANKVMFVDKRDNLAIAYIESSGKTLLRKEYLTLVNSDKGWVIVNSISSLSKK